MTDYIKKRDPVLENLTEVPLAEAPKEIKSNEVKLKRVARPLRHVRNIPTKAAVFHSKTGPITFSYENKIKLPINKNKIVVQVQYAALNPIDLKIKNGYTNSVYGEAGLGREYYGVITHLGDSIMSTNNWQIGDKVMGIYYHPHLAKGALQSSILVDPNEDIIVLKPDNLNEKEAAGTLFCLGTAFNALDRLQRKKFLTKESNILINGGTSSVAMFAIQLLKRFYQVQKKLVVVTTGTSEEALLDYFPDLSDDFIFIDYLSCRGKSSRPLRKMLKNGQIVQYRPTPDNIDNEITVEYNEGKFDIVLDFIGGYDILSHSSDLIHAGGAYLTTVGDYVGNYKTDIFNQWDNPSANARKLFGSMLYSYDYTHFYFDPNASHAKSNDWVSIVCELLQKGVVTTIIDKVYNWKEITEAVSYMKTQRAKGKVILQVDEF